MSAAMLALRVLVSLACVVGIVWYAGRRLGARRQAATSREPSVRLVDRQSLGRHAGVAVVAVGNRRLLLGFGEQQVTMLTELSPVAEQLPAPHADHTPAPRTVLPTPRRPAEATAPTGRPAAGGALDGSVLSPATWRSVVKTLQDRTVRR
jgi:flagellar protein FliO/FliZ